MKTTFAATAAFLSATSYASTVTLQTTKCPSSSAPIEQFKIELNTQEAVPKFLSSVCGLEIISASSDFYLKDIQCQAFKDAEGTVPGSAIFTYDEPANIATNPVQEQSILCVVSVTPDETLKRRQVFPSSLSDEIVFTTGIATSDIITATGVITSDLVGTPSPRPAASSSTTDDDNEDDSTTTASDATEGVTRSTVVITSTASGLTTIETLPSSGMPSSTNGTSLSTTRPTPTQSSSAPSESTNAAGQAAIGLGVVAAAFAALAL